MLYEWKASRLSKQSRGERIEYAMQIKWKRPLQGYLKCNVDVSFFNHTNRVGKEPVYEMRWGSSLERKPCGRNH